MIAAVVGPANDVLDPRGVVAKGEIGRVEPPCGGRCASGWSQLQR